MNATKPTISRVRLLHAGRYLVASGIDRDPTGRIVDARLTVADRSQATVTDPYTAAEIADWYGMADGGILHTEIA